MARLFKGNLTHGIKYLHDVKKIRGYKANSRLKPRPADFSGESPIRQEVVEYLKAGTYRTRTTLRVNDHAGPGLQLSISIKVTAGPPVVAECPMYFNYSGFAQP